MQRRSLFKRLGAAAIAAPLALAAATRPTEATAVAPAPPVPPGFAPSNLEAARLVAQQHQAGLVSRSTFMSDYLAGFPSYTRDEPTLAAILAGLDLRAIQRQAGCPDGCTLRYLGESLLYAPVYLFRHERFTGDEVVGGDIKIDSVLDPVRSDPAHLSAHIVKWLRQHHAFAAAMQLVRDDLSPSSIWHEIRSQERATLGGVVSNPMQSGPRRAGGLA
jgi:hypothetical protein